MTGGMRCFSPVVFFHHKISLVVTVSGFREVSVFLTEAELLGPMVPAIADSTVCAAVHVGV